MLLLHQKLPQLQHLPIHHHQQQQQTTTTNKRYCSKFKKEWYLVRVFLRFNENAKRILQKLCVACSIQFSIQNSGIGDINSHKKSKKHLEYLKSAKSNRCKIYP